MCILEISTLDTIRGGQKGLKGYKLIYCNIVSKLQQKMAKTVLFQIFAKVIKIPFEGLLIDM